jgi:hypothetical protein
MTGDRHTPSLRWVFVLAVFSFGLDLIPAVCFNQPHYIAHFLDVASSLSSILP